ncbi:MAG TPA: SCO family protein [Woeseiaceae bacterium]|nr:SCO family protein [Woeseiaceae bacterium]
MSRVLRLSALVLAAVAVAAGAWLAARALEKPSLPRFATVLAEPRPLPEFSLTDQDNRPFDAARLRGHTSLLFFGFTHCPDICPATLAQLAAARQQLAAAGAELPQIVLVTVDPERDTPEVLARYVGYFGAGITGVTGPVGEIRALAEPLGVYFEKTPLGDAYTMGHSTAVLVVGPDVALQALFTAPHDVDAFVHDLPILMASG